MCGPNPRLRRLHHPRVDDSDGRLGASDGLVARGLSGVFPLLVHMGRDRTRGDRRHRIRSTPKRAEALDGGQGRCCSRAALRLTGTELAPRGFQCPWCERRLAITGKSTPLSSDNTLCFGGVGMLGSIVAVLEKLRRLLA